MDRIVSPAHMRSWAYGKIRQGKIIALVPTMGALHDGHLSLIRMARDHADHVIVSIFVNPLQFGPQEDFTVYPRNLEKDSALAEQEGADVVFAPTAEEMYPQKSLTRVSVSTLTEFLCGACRPGHFEGVATVVAKLFNITLPHFAVFGQKDLQQLAVIRRMVHDLNWGIEILAHPIVREADGLAMSSRNAYLSQDDRRAATSLNRSIHLARDLAAKGEQNVSLLCSEVEKCIKQAGVSRVAYISIVDSCTMAPKEVVDKESVLAIAAYVGSTRLIDNGYILP